MAVLVDKLKEFTALGLSGKINVVHRENSQHIGIVFFKKGLLVNCSYEGEYGLRPLFDLVLTDFSLKEHFYYIVEPEILSGSVFKFQMTFDDLLRVLQDQSFRPWEELRPPESLRLSVVKEFFIKTSKINILEESLLKTINNYSRVSDIYKNSNILDPLITSLLVSLRKKGALRVLE